MVTVIAAFETMEEVDEALRRLADDGLPGQNLSVLTEHIETAVMSAAS